MSDFKKFAVLVGAVIVGEYVWTKYVAPHV